MIIHSNNQRHTHRTFFEGEPAKNFLGKCKIIICQLQYNLNINGFNIRSKLIKTVPETVNSVVFSLLSPAAQQV
jgi:hypothetical protein